MEGLPNRNAELTLYGCDSPESASGLLEAVHTIEGVEEVSLKDGVLHVEYCPQFVLLPYIEEKILEAGFTRSAAAEKRQRKSFFSRFLDRLIESNEKTFGSERLDCCTLNEKKKT